MTISEWILLGQLVILGATGVIIIWYTYETSIIRKETTRQAILTPSAKLWDRQNDLDRLVFSSPEVAQMFMQMANRSQPFFTASADEVPRDRLYCQLKAFVYLHLNFFEEVYLTTSNSVDVANQFEREDWDDFIFQYMRHALLREVYNAEKDRAYTGEFVRYLSKNKDKWEGEADIDLF
ncbi:MAG: hypothetical protein ACPF9D_01050 [Owenweeksia sp.]